METFFVHKTEIETLCQKGVSIIKANSPCFTKPENIIGLKIKSLFGKVLPVYLLAISPMGEDLALTVCLQGEYYKYSAQNKPERAPQLPEQTKA